MNLKPTIALLLAFGMVAAACGGSGSDGEDTSTDETTAETEAGADDTTEDTEAGSGDEEDGAMADPADIATDFGVTDDTIRIGINGDLSGPFAALVSEVVEAQNVYWEWVNDNGGIAGRQIELVILDNGYDTAKGIENYEELAQENEDGVLIISENTGSPITAAIAEDAIDDDMLMVPLTWASLWPDLSLIHI